MELIYLPGSKTDFSSCRYYLGFTVNLWLLKVFYLGLRVACSQKYHSGHMTAIWAQSTVDFPVGGHVDVLSDYKETGPEKNVNTITAVMSLIC